MFNEACGLWLVAYGLWLVIMSKKLCKEEDKKAIAKRGRKAEYECRSCGAEAVKEKFLCKPKKI
jgi:hypothetical protein